MLTKKITILSIVQHRFGNKEPEAGMEVGNGGGEKAAGYQINKQKVINTLAKQ